MAKSDTPGGNGNKPTKSGIGLEDFLVQSKIVRTDGQRKAALDMLGIFLDQVLEQGNIVGNDSVAFIAQRLAQVDSLLSQQLNEVLHTPEFQQIESSWRGLHYLVYNSNPSTRLKLRVLDIEKRELLEDLEQIVEFDQSQLFKKIYEEEYGTFGGHPYSCLVGDYYFSRSSQDVALLEQISQVASAAHAPFIAAAHPNLFDLDSFQHLAMPRDLSKIFDTEEMIRWNAFRESEESRYVTLALPRVLLRLPYGRDFNPVDGISFEEKVNGFDNSNFCWGNPAYVLGERIANAFFLYGWTAAIRGVEGGGIVKNLPVYTFKTTDGYNAVKCPTEVAITDRREKELSDLGFVALCYCKGTNYAAFFGGQTTQQPKVYDKDEANANANLSARLPYILAASRFAHYIKAIMRDKIGKFTTKDEVSRFLNNWIAKYVLLNDNAPQAAKSKYPLRQAKIDVYSVPGKPGAYRSVIYIRPHFQLEELTASLRLVATLPQAAK